MGTKLKQLCRGGLLPTLAKVGRHRGWAEDMQVCQMCSQGVKETQRHVLMECDRYRVYRQKTDTILAGMTPEARYAKLLGMRSGDAGADALVDSATKRMLEEIWKERRKLTQSSMRFLTGRTWLDDPQPGPEHWTRDAGTGPKTGRVDPHMAPPAHAQRDLEGAQEANARLPRGRTGGGTPSVPLTRTDEDLPSVRAGGGTTPGAARMCWWKDKLQTD